jgi:acyl-CoA synthetase (AMP-forming)/AMP-acid ligase II/acyl carrier protein
MADPAGSESASPFASVEALISANARERPTKLALCDVEGVGLTYGELLPALRLTTDGLASAGIEPGERVAVILPNGFCSALVSLAAMRIGCLVPLNPSSTDREITDVLNRVRPRLVVTGPCMAAADTANRLGIPVAEVNGVSGILNGELRFAAPVIARRTATSNDAVVIPTSGTTSRPKLVRLTHKNVLAAATAAAAKPYALESTDIRLNIMPMFHLQGLLGGVVAPLITGGTSICATSFVAEDVYTWIERFEATWFAATPAMHQLLLDASHAESDLTSIRFVRIGSAPSSGEFRKRVAEVFDAPVIEAYGMTEAFEIASTDVEGPASSRAVGPPRACEVSVRDIGLDTNAGELLVRGPTVTPGYLDECGNEDEDHFVDEDWFCTGDVGYIDERGQVVIHGRRQEFINRGGEKISPYEVEEAILTCAHVGEVAVFPVSHPVLGEDVAAAIVPRETFDSPDAIRKTLTPLVAPHKIPREILVLESLPRTETGKIQRGALREILETKHAAKATPLERTVVTLWQDAFGLERVELSDSFFELGGDSFVATALRAAVSDAFGVTLPADAVYDETDTPERMARAIVALRAGG